MLHTTIPQLFPNGGRPIYFCVFLCDLDFLSNMPYRQHVTMEILVFQGVTTFLSW
jgi:hypothetical protein